MWPFSFLSSVYQLDNLDTRLTTPSSVPYHADADRSDGHAAIKKERDGRSLASKWNTPEFYFYYLVLLIAIPYMFWVVFDVSKPSDPRYPKFEHLLAPGWIPGRMVDASDPQYHTFRSNLPYLAALLVLHPLCRRIWNATVGLLSSGGGGGGAPPTSTAEREEARLGRRVSFDFAFAFAFLVALHGFSAVKVLAILSTNYSIATAMPTWAIPTATWVFNISILFANELCRGYRFRDMASLVTGNGDSLLLSTGQWLDSWGGLMPRWEILFNITVLRLISFNLDYYWSLERRSLSPIELDPANLSERDRVSMPARIGDYSFRNYVAYAVYAPLYLAGPILTFNDYIAQQRHRLASIETPRTIRYGARFILALLAMEVLLHFQYVGAIGQANPVWSSYTAAQLSLLSYFNLHLIWLKLLLAWRLFRLWALLDGVDPPENILRCVSNNFSPLSFWRAWHRSYNRWLIRYVYVPLGGADFGSRRRAARSMLNYVVIFTFVALWHDIQLRLLVWGWLIVLFFVPEVLAGCLFPRRKWEHRPTAYRMLCCMGAVGNVLAMMSANLVGFAVGIDGLESILSGIFHDLAGVLFLVVACFVLFVGIQVMFEIRESELRKGVRLRC